MRTVGAPLAGRIADRTVVQWRKRRGGVWVPEDRLRAALWGAGVFVPLSVLLTGITIKYVPGTPGIVLNLCWMFMNGIGVRSSFMIAEMLGLISRTLSLR